MGLGAVAQITASLARGIFQADVYGVASPGPEAGSLAFHGEEVCLLTLAGMAEVRTVLCTVDSG